MHEEDVRPPNEKSHDYHLSITYNGCEILLTDPACNSCSPQMPI